MRSKSLWQSIRQWTVPAAVLTLALGAWAQLALAADPVSDPAKRADSTWPPKGAPTRVEINRDTVISSVGSEARGNGGGAAKWKMKGIQEFELFDADLAALKGKVVTGALLHIKTTSPKEPALRVSVSTVATPWVEGTGSSYKEEAGSACFVSPELGKRDWAFPGSTMLDAAWGKGQTIWRFAEATVPDKDGWQVVAVEPDVVAATLAGLSHGFAAMDDVGSIWSYKDGKFDWQVYMNRFFASREDKKNAPYFEVWTDGEDKEAPDALTDLAVDTAGLPEGEALVTWKTPADKGGGHTLGFNVIYKAGDKSGPMPRYLIPMAGKPGQTVKMLIQDLPFKAGESIELTIVPVDSAGNVGKAFTKAIKVSATPATFDIKASALAPFEPSDKLPDVGGLKVAVLDLIDKVEAKSGKMIPDHPAGYKGGNHVWSAEKKLVRLQAGRNEQVCFQVNLEGKSEGVTAKLEFAGNDRLKSKVYRFDYVAAGGGNMPDALLPLEGALPIPCKDDPQAADQSNASLLCEIYVPHEETAGVKKGKVTIGSGGQTLDLEVELTVWDFTLPNKLSFIPELNCYGTAMPTGPGLAFYRMAHENRCCLNRLYYNWNGGVRDGAAPEKKGDGFDWTRYDKEFGPLFDGSAFADLPRKGEPVDLFYLPFNEHWPMDVFKNYTKNYWADEAFTPEYVDGFRKAAGEFAKHFNEKKWHGTGFEFYLNNKVYYKKGKPFESVSAPWCLDEPANTQDFWALRWYNILYHQGADPVRGQTRMWSRADVSRSQYDRDMFWGTLDIEVMGGAGTEKIRQKRDEQFLSRQDYFTVYGSANDPGSSNIQPVVWSLQAFASGTVGVLPWQVIGTKKSWETGENTCLFYPSDKGPVASVRLKAFCRGQEDVEYLTLLGDACQQPRFAVVNGFKKLVDLSGKIRKTSEEDAGTISFDNANPGSLWKLRVAVGEMVSARKPAYKRALVEMPNPVSELGNLPNIGYVTVAPKVPSSAPDRD